MSSTTSSSSINSIPNNLNHLVDGLNPLLIATKILGLLPLTKKKVQGEKIYKRTWTSKESFYSLFIFAWYVHSCAIFVPFLWASAEKREATVAGTSLKFLLETIFFSSHMAAGVLAYVFVQRNSARLGAILNGLSQQMAYLVQYDPELGKSSFRKTNVLLVLALSVWLAIPISFFINKSGELCSYFESIPNWLAQAGLLLYFIQVVSHFFQSFLFERIIEVIGDCLLALGNLSEHFVKDADSFLALYERFKVLEKMCDQLSCAYGLYFIAEVVTLVVSTVIHLYFIIFKHSAYPDHVNSYLVPASIIFGNGIWLITVGNSGNSYKLKVTKCMEALLKVARNNVDCSVDLRLVEPLMKLSAPPKPIHFSHYANMDRSLPTTILSVLATYFVIIVQFHVSDPDGKDIDGLE